MSAIDSMALLMVFFTPGLLWLLFLSHWKEMRFIEIVISSFGLSLVSLPLLLAFSGYFDLVIPISAIWVFTVFCGIASLLYLLSLRRSKDQQTLKLSRDDVYAILLLAFHIGLWYLYFLKYPVFYGSFVNDPLWHVATALQVAQSGGRSLLQSLQYPLALHYILSLVVRWTNYEPIVVCRWTVASIESLTVLLVYSVGARFFKNSRCGLFCAFAYSILIPVGIIHFDNAGTFSNILANFYTVLALFMLDFSLINSSAKTYLTQLAIGTALIFSHFSSFTLISFLWLFAPVVYIYFRNLFKRYMLSISSLSAGLVAILLVFPNLLANISRVLYGPYSLLLPGDAFFRSLYDSVPILGILYGFAGLPNLAIIVVACALLLWRFRQELWYPFVSGYFIYSCVLSLQGGNVWRFGLYALFVAVLSEGYLIWNLQKLIFWKVSRLSSHALTNTINSRGLLIIVLLALATTGPFFRFANNLPGDSAPERQIAIYQSMKWIGSNTSRDSCFLSVGLLEYLYLPVVANRTFQGDYEIPPEEIYSLSKQDRIDYVAVSTRDERLEAFKSNELFELMFENEYVLIFHIKRVAD